MPASRRTPPFLGRSRERAELDELLGRARQGNGSVLVIQGEAGIGKTGLLRYCASRAAGFRVLEVSGVESEMELPFAALHQLCGPFLDRIGTLPAPQQQALQVVFGLADGSPPDPFLLGLATLGLLAEAAVEQPLACLVDDAQWLDNVSKRVLAFVGRRLNAESVFLLFAIREDPDEHGFDALPRLSVTGLTEDDARELLAAAVPGPLEGRVRDRLIAETRGNPLALVELAGAMSQADLAGGLVRPGPLPDGSVRPGPLSGGLHDHYLRLVSDLPEPARLFLALAAADPTADAALVWRAARTLGLGWDAAATVEAEQLLTIGPLIYFRHPLVRSAAYAAVTPAQRREVHRALAEATDPRADPDRRLSHRAAAATAPDEDIAAELEQAAARAEARGGRTAAAGFWQRSAALSGEPGRRADRTLAAALAHLQAGSIQSAAALLAEAAAHVQTDLQRALIARLRGQIGWASFPGPSAAVQLLRSAIQLDVLDAGLAREAYLDAWGASLIAGRLSDSDGLLPEVSRAALRSVSSDGGDPGRSKEPEALLLHGLATLIVDGLDAAGPTLRGAVDAFLADPDPAWFQKGANLVSTAAALLWDFDGWAALSSRWTEHARASGALVPLVSALSVHELVAAWRGDLEEAAAVRDEGDALAEVLGTRMFPLGAALLAAYQGRPAETVPLLDTIAAEAVERSEGITAQSAHWAQAILHNGLGRYPDALAAAELAVDETYLPQLTWWVLPELAEAASRTGNPDLAERACERLAGNTYGSDWALGLTARCRALLAEGAEAERLYQEAITRLGRTQLRPEFARALLLYGEWLRREQRPGDARQRLREAHEVFTAMGAEAFAERARRELAATGEKIGQPSPQTTTGLTAQEEHIARLARDGRTNSEIGAELFISARTVEWHLRNVYTKLGIASRKGLREALPVHAGGGVALR